MKKILSLFLAVILVLSMTTVSTTAQNTPKLYIIGDGIVADWGNSAYPTQGWGEYFKNTVNDIEAVNAARHDSDMTSYIADGHWEAIAKDLKEGDFVVVAFGAESIDARGKSQYSKALIKYALDTKQKGAEIIFVTPAPITESLAQNEKLTPMTESIRTVANMLSIPVIDLNALVFCNAESDLDIKPLYNAFYLSNTQLSYFTQRGTISEFAKNEALSKRGIYLSNQGAKHMANVVARAIYSSDTNLSKYMKNVDNPTERPVYYDVLNEMNTGEIRGILYDGMDYKGVPTQVFAYLGIPEGVTADNPAPAMVLVHGGGGKAYLDWVEKWVEKGYVALSYYFMERKANSDNTLPDGSAIYYHQGKRKWDDIDDSVHEGKPDDEQWMYHATADASLAYTLLDSLPQVADGQIGISGISWGAVVTASAIGRDTRFKLAIPVYGAGYLDENLGNIHLVSKWDGRHNFDKVKASGMKTLWINSPTDHYFDVTTTSKSAAACGGDILICYMLNHGEPTGAGLKGTLNEIFSYTDSVFRGGTELPKLSAPKKSGSKVALTVNSDVPIENTTLYYTTSGVVYNGTCSSLWLSKSAEINGDKITATLPDGTKGYYIQVTDSNGNRITTGYQANDSVK